MRPSRLFGITGWRAALYDLAVNIERAMVRHRVPGWLIVRRLSFRIGQIKF